MENNYQESVNYLKNYSDDYDEIGKPMYPYKYSKDYKENVDNLQELIDKTTICGLSLDEVMPVIEMYKKLKTIAPQNGKQSIQERIDKSRNIVFSTMNLIIYENLEKENTKLQQANGNYCRLLKEAHTNERKLEKALDKALDLLLLQNDGKVNFKKDPLITIRQSKESLKEMIFEEVKNNYDDRNKR